MLFRKTTHYDYDLIVIGSGSGGSVSAHYAASRGKKVAIFEKDAVGGECPNYACVPTKALLHSAMTYEHALHAKDYGITVEKPVVHYPNVKRWKELVVSRTGASHGDASFSKSGIDLIREEARFVDSHTVEAGGTLYTAHKVLLATGSTTFIPEVTGLKETGFMTYQDAVNLSTLPKSLLIFGGGAIGCEFAQIFATLGTQVTLVNRSDRLLKKEDQEVGDLVQALFESGGVTVLTGTSLVKVEKLEKTTSDGKKQMKKIVHMQKGEHHSEFFEEVDEILIATGKVPSLDFLPEKAGLTVKHHRLVVNKQLQTNVAHIYAAGDLVGPYLFTHSAEYQSYLAAQNMFSRKKQAVDYSVVPRCVFITPEVASVGLSEEEARARDIRIKKGITPIASLGRANTSNHFDGFVKVITNEKGVLIGASIVAPRAGEMIHELALAIRLRVKASVIANMIHAYPTYSEAVKIACDLLE